MTEIIENMPADEYHASEAIGGSKYSRVWDKDGEAIKAYMDRVIVPSEVMEFGTLVHAAILEEHTLDSLYVIWEGDKRKEKKRWAEFKEENANKIITTQERLEGLVSIGKRIKKNKEAMTLLNQCETEQSIFWHADCGAKCKARLDVVNVGGNVFADIKTTGKVEFRDFCRSVDRDGMFVQVGHYAEAYRRAYEVESNPCFWFICIENVHPYRIACRPMSSEYLEYGRQMAIETVTKIHIGNYAGCWSTLADEEGIQEIAMPEWAKPKPTLDFT